MYSMSLIDFATFFSVKKEGENGNMVKAAKNGEIG